MMTSKGLFWVFQELWFLFNVFRGVSGSGSINWALWTLLMCETLGQYLLSTRYCNKRLLTFKKNHNAIGKDYTQNMVFCALCYIRVPQRKK